MSCGHAKMGERTNYVFYHVQEGKNIAKGATAAHLCHDFDDKMLQRVLKYAEENPHMEWNGDYSIKIIVKA